LGRFLINFGPKDIILVNRRVIIYEGRPDLNPIVSKMARATNRNKLKGHLNDAIKGAKTKFIIKIFMFDSLLNF
jgi:malate dehydrogenase (oxaloacetate-decarboxylating)